jgi:hypothetical protein
MRRVPRRERSHYDETAMAEIPKRLKRLLREYAGKAHEAELREALAPIAEAFKRWERGEIDSFDLKDLIHQFHQGPAREIYLRYYDRAPEPPVAYAIVSGLIDRATVPAELLNHLARLITRYEDERKS